jgi:hypothetical protein
VVGATPVVVVAGAAEFVGAVSAPPPSEHDTNNNMDAVNTVKSR